LEPGQVLLAEAEEAAVDLAVVLAEHRRRAADRPVCRVRPRILS
jgi:hypothetical protein